MKKNSIGDNAKATLFSQSVIGLRSSVAAHRVKGRITCFYPLTGEVDIRDNRGHTWKVRLDA